MSATRRNPSDMIDAFYAYLRRTEGERQTHPGTGAPGYDEIELDAFEAGFEAGRPEPVHRLERYRVDLSEEFIVASEVRYADGSAVVTIRRRSDIR